MMLAGPLFQQQIRTHLLDRTKARLYRAYVVVLAVIVFLAWPSYSISYYLQFSSKPITLPLTILVMFVFSYILALVPDYSDEHPQSNLTDWIFYTPVRVLTAFGGSLLFSIVHVVFILGLPAPLLVAAAAASGVTAKTVLSACAVTFIFSLFSKQLILMLKLISEKRFIIRTLVFGCFLVFAVLLSVRFYPDANPLLAVQSALAGTDEVEWHRFVRLYGIGTGAVAIVSVLRLASLRREAEARP